MLFYEIPAVWVKTFPSNVENSANYRLFFESYVDKALTILLSKVLMK